MSHIPTPSINSLTNTHWFYLAMGHSEHLWLRGVDFINNTADPSIKCPLKQSKAERINVLRK
jgi:hypothetical protein